MNQRNIPKKNYIIFSIISLATIVITFYLVMWYNTSKEYMKNNSVMLEVIRKIDIDSLPNYILESPDAVIYLSSSTDETVKSFEEKFKQYIIKHEIKDQILYLDTNELEEADYQKIVSKHFSDQLKKKNITLLYVPNVLIFQDGKVEKVLYNYQSDMDLSDIEANFMVYGVVNRD